MNVSWKGRCGWSGPLIDQPQPLWHGGSHRPQSRVPTMSGMQSAMMASKMREGVSRVTAPGGHACSRDFVFALLRQSPQAPQACCAYRKLTGASAVETSLELLGGKVYNLKTRHAGRLDFPSRRQDTPPGQGDSPS